MKFFEDNIIDADIWRLFRLSLASPENVVPDPPDVNRQIVKLFIDPDPGTG